MENERRVNDPNQYCPDHKPYNRCREGDIMICLAHGCTWNAPARRPIDKLVPTKPEMEGR